MMEKREVIFEGNEKRIFATDDPKLCIIHFKDMSLAYGGIKRAIFKGKGKYTNRISAIIFKALAEAGVPNHFVEVVSETEQLCRKIEIIPLQIVVRNRLCGTTAELLGVENGTMIPNTVYEIRYNCDKLSDPMINADHVVALGILSYNQMDYVMKLAEKTNAVLGELFDRVGIELVDFKMEIGRLPNGEIIISDEISPDNSRLWDKQTGRILDKDRFRHDYSDVTAAYREVMERLQKSISE
ncbi:MAG: phosphoribosylaminoimidazolesuccinocarboxamide synthase [Bacteroidales bacterium]|nr:phosphoribosylaminoimidazolesuccinocarboxamide synthase [Bacteroidales bacterium]